MNDNKVNWCRICEDYYSESLLDVQKHIMGEHSLEARIQNLHEKGAEPEDALQ